MVRGPFPGELSDYKTYYLSIVPLGQPSLTPYTSWVYITLLQLAFDMRLASIGH